MISKKSIVMNKTKIWAGFISILSLFLLLVSIFHRGNLDSTQYPHSFLVPILMLTMLLLIFSHLISFVTMFVLVFSKAWKKILFLFIVEILTGVLLLISLFIDAPTFIFMT